MLHYWYHFPDNWTQMSFGEAQISTPATFWVWHLEAPRDVTPKV